MTPRRRAILIVLLALILLAIIGLAVYLLTRSVASPATSVPLETESPTDVVEPPQEPEEVYQNPLLPPAEEPAPAAVEGRQVAELFAERYGSYSNQGEYQNLRDLLPVMTTRYRSETEAFLEDAAPVAGQPYEGVTSRKVSTSVRAMTAGSAVIAVMLQQEKSSSTGGPVVGYRSLRMELVKVGDVWLVDRATWEN